MLHLPALLETRWRAQQSGFLVFILELLLRSLSCLSSFGFCEVLCSYLPLQAHSDVGLTLILQFVMWESAMS